MSSDRTCLSIDAVRRSPLEVTCFSIRTPCHPKGTLVRTTRVGPGAIASKGDVKKEFACGLNRSSHTPATSFVEGVEFAVIRLLHIAAHLSMISVDKQYGWRRRTAVLCRFGFGSHGQHTRRELKEILDLFRLQ